MSCSARAEPPPRNLVLYLIVATLFFFPTLSILRISELPARHTDGCILLQVLRLLEREPLPPTVTQVSTADPPKPAAGSPHITEYSYTQGPLPWPPS